LVAPIASKHPQQQLRSSPVWDKEIRGTQKMRDFVLDAPGSNRYTYFVAYYGKEFHQQTAVLHVMHNFDVSVQDLHIQIRSRINEVLGEETPSCYHILALAAPEAIPA
jgi:hypothetical protein